MQLFEALYNTYLNLEYKAGVYEKGQEPLLPLYHWYTGADIEIRLDQDGNFKGACGVGKKDPDENIIYPDSEESASRTSVPEPNPLCDCLKYYVDEQLRNVFMNNLKNWIDSSYSHPKLNAVYDYLLKDTILSDLINSGVISEYEAKAEKFFVRWVVFSNDRMTPECWKDKSLFDAWVKYYTHILESKEKIISSISGKSDYICHFHRKNIYSLAGNAKLVSANDKKNFSYRGRFLNPEQAVVLGLKSSQRAHAALKYLLSNYGVTFGDKDSKRVFVCWNPNEKPVPDFLHSTGLFCDSNENLDNIENYKLALKETLYGKGMKLSDSDYVYVASFEAPISGRLSVIYYRELSGSEFLKNLAIWYSTLCSEVVGNDRNAKIATPTIQQIIKFAYGDNSTDFQVKDKIQISYAQSLVQCMVDNLSVPYELYVSIVEKCRRLANYPLKIRNSLLMTATAVIRKHINDTEKKEVYTVTLDKECTDRSYLFGRLLAIAERVEMLTYFNKEDKERETNAERLQEYFTRSPFTAWNALENQLKPYFASLKAVQKEYYRQMIGEVFGLFDTNDISELNKPLKSDYLLGYYHQRNEFKKTIKSDKTEEDVENE